MRRILYVGLLFFSLGKADETITVTIGSVQEYAPTNLMMLVSPDDKKELSELIPFIVKDLSFTGQITPVSKEITGVVPKSALKECALSGYPVVVVIKKKEREIMWWLYDSHTTSLLAHNSYRCTGLMLRGWAHQVADQLWQVLMNQRGFFSTKIAYCKDQVQKLNNGTLKRMKYICVADYDGSHEQLLVQTPTINVAPRWNQDPHNPLLFYSECTNNNMRLMVVDMHKKRKIASNFDGLNMLPTFSREGSIVVYCASRGDGTCQLYLYKKEGLKRLTHNTGNNVSPTLAADGQSLFFCSDFKTGSPQIYHYNFVTETVEPVTDGGYCAAPAFCSVNNKLVYSKIIEGTMQLMLYDPETKSHRQLTNDAGNKQEASWSPCGHYLLFTIAKGTENRLALFNLTAENYRMVTNERDTCTYPHWSGVYTSFPVIG